MIRFALSLALILSVLFASVGRSDDQRYSVWCDSAPRGTDHMTYMVTFTLVYNATTGTCTALGDSGEYGSSFEHRFDCKIERSDKSDLAFYRIELNNLETSSPSGNPDRAVEVLRIYYDLKTQFGQGLVRTKGGELIGARCITGPFRH